MGHKTSQYFLFRDLIQGAIKDNGLKFADKPPMKIDANPLQVDAHYAEPSCINMVEVSEDFINKPVFGSFTEDISIKAVKKVQRRAAESLNKGATEGSNKGTTERSYLVAVTSSTEILEAKMQKLSVAGKSNVGINMVEVSEPKATDLEDNIRQEKINKLAFPKEN